MQLLAAPVKQQAVQGMDPALAHALVLGRMQDPPCQDGGARAQQKGRVLGLTQRPCRVRTVRTGRVHTAYLRIWPLSLLVGLVAYILLSSILRDEALRALPGADSLTAVHVFQCSCSPPRPLETHVPEPTCAHAPGVGRNLSVTSCTQCTLPMPAVARVSPTSFPPHVLHPPLRRMLHPARYRSNVRSPIVYLLSRPHTMPSTSSLTRPPPTNPSHVLHPSHSTPTPHPRAGAAPHPTLYPPPPPIPTRAEGTRGARGAASEAQPHRRLPRSAAPSAGGPQYLPAPRRVGDKPL